MGDHYYDIKNEKDEILFQNTNTACFAEVFSIMGERSYFKPENRMIIICPKKFFHDKSLIDPWVKYLKYLGFPFKWELTQYKRESIKNEYVLKFDEELYTFTTKFSDYKSYNHFILGCHLIRYLFHGSNYVALQNAYEVKKLYPKCSLFELFQYAHLKDSGRFAHDWISSYDLCKFLSVFDLKDYLKKSEGDKYDYYFVSNLFTKRKRYPVKVDLFWRENKKLDWKDYPSYKKIVEKF